MKIIVPSLEIQSDEGFKKDIFNRKPFGEALLRLVSRSSDGLVISLDGKWGEGKTTFVKMWQGLLKEEGIPSIYIDAFQNDYTGDAFISIASAITSYVEEHSKKSTKVIEFKKNAQKVGVGLLSLSAKIAIKAATIGIVGQCEIEALAEIGKEIGNDASKKIEKMVAERLSSHSQERDLIVSFRESLSEVPAELNDNKSNQLVIIIDELDRCKPSFAVEVLEKVKHLFSVENVTFLLVMHKEQLEEAIRSIYGSNIDAHTYLQKFINVEVAVPKKMLNVNDNDLSVYVKKLITLHELSDYNKNDKLFSSIYPLAQFFHLSLRQIEKVFTNISIMHGIADQNQEMLYPITGFICIMKVVKPEIFRKMAIGQIPYTELFKEAGFSMIDESSGSPLSVTIKWVRFAMLDPKDYDQDSTANFSHFEKEIERINLRREEIMSSHCGQLYMFKVNN